MTSLFAVIGNPVAHSRSPTIHQLFAQQFGHRLDYRRKLATDGSFRRVVAELFRCGFKGVNVTAPFKQQAYQLATHRSPAAQSAKAVNTLIPTEAGGLLGANTDGMGLVYDLRRLNVQLAGAKVLILGAGGAAQGALPDLLAQNPGAVLVTNRDDSKAVALAQHFPQCQAVSDWSQVDGIDVIINATSASLFGQRPELPERVAAEASMAYDMVYADRPTVFMEYAWQCGVERCADGLGMLVGQAAESYRLWWNVQQPEIETVIRAIRPA